MHCRTVLSGWALLLLASKVQLTAALPPLQQPLHGSHSDHDSASSQYGTHGAVACESAICSKIGVDLMRKGGTAADALVGATLCVGVIGMYHSGIGGGGFLLVRGSDGSYEGVDYRETAPAAAFENMYDGNVLGSVFGGLAVAVPSELRGLEYLHNNYGVLPWETVVMPAVEVARNGFPVSHDLVRYMKSATETGGPFLTDDPIWSEDFAPNGTLLQLGDTITRKRYANTLETLAKEGIETFYTGAMAKDMVKLIRENNGSLTLDDFKNYEIISKPAVSTLFRGRRLFSTSAPSSGAVALSILKTMEQFPASGPPGSSDSERNNVNLSTHRFDEAMRFAYGARSHLGDPAYVDGVAAREADLLSDQHAKTLRQKIRDDTTLPVKDYNPAGSYAQPGHGTSHVVATDRSGMAVSSTTTINTLFGSLLMTPDSGIILNNQMNDFSIPHSDNEFGYPPSPANFIRGGKRPLSSITPIIAEDVDVDAAGVATGKPGRPYLVTGAAGGSRIISATAQVAWRVLEQGFTMHEALAEPRLHDQLVPNLVAFEALFDKSTIASMVERGHNVTSMSNYVSSAQGIRVLPDGVFEAAGEPRQLNSGGHIF
ncbi:gamma-glutamyltranspeptidase [Sporothrix schenckii 1099-18]|uniref:Glutathione hydrolase n=2 Tax=Sporothrix schenckii TaxID=29908 RepID=U7PQ51_SPOS1|nr:gamma-glutamyltranspeptidase [Sporothrix schenckii 1099-18]ERS96610.1 gamma-glutamyltransferase [Sporothrix schenckii ATCC 58251]KJR81294.1 gamma-glutamyltranspeptidase [Sporothrix schenckii 1099-18]